MLGWAIEDAVMLLLERRGTTAILAGNDRFREFLNPKQISTQPDIIFKSKIGQRMLEIFSDWKGTWRNQNHADLRDGKFLKLKKHGAIMVGLAPLSSEGFLMDFSIGNNGFEENFIPAYRKTGYTRKGIRETLKPLQEVMNELLAI